MRSVAEIIKGLAQKNCRHYAPVYCCLHPDCLPTEIKHIQEDARVTQTTEEIASYLFGLANKLAGDQYGHLAGIIHCVVGELQTGASFFESFERLKCQLNLIEAIKATKDSR